MNVFATDRSVSVRCVLILFHSGHLVGHHVANLQFIYKPLIAWGVNRGWSKKVGVTTLMVFL